MLKQQIVVSVPTVEILSNVESAALSAQGETEILIALEQDFDGALSGRALLFFPIVVGFASPALFSKTISTSKKSRTGTERR